MIVTVFRSRLRPEALDEYMPMAIRMHELATAMPGYILHKTFTAEDGERLTLVEFADEEAHQAWAKHPEHIGAQRAGRQKFYSEYSIAICEVLRQRDFVRPSDR
jgi:heme-degrading monooxygenase HmoA